MAKKEQSDFKDLIPKDNPEFDKIVQKIGNTPESRKEVAKFLTRLLNRESKLAGKVGGEIAIKEYSKKIEDWCAPLPRPKDLANYKKIYPDAPKIIIEQMEKQGNHRRKMEELFLKSDFKVIRAGQIFAFIILLLLSCGGMGLLFASLLIGESITGSIAGVIVAIGGLGGLLAIFFKKPKDDKNSLPPT